MSAVKYSGVMVALAAGLGAGIGATLTLLLARTRRQKKSKNVQVWGTQPHPGWTPPEKLPVREAIKNADMMAIDPRVIGGKKCYPLIISTVVPRPVAFVSTLSKNGDQNLAPFSYFTAFHDPPCGVIVVCRAGHRNGGKKDTMQNIDDTKEFTVNVLSEWFLEQANHTCGNYDADVNEMELSGLTTLPSLKVKPPRVKESAVHMECKLKHKYETTGYNGEDTATVVVGEIVMFHVNEHVAKKTPSGSTYVGLEELEPISRLGGNIYGRSRECFDMPRPDRDWQSK
jgi:flavin reductase (DIM6/NTAB) family NADH-FMN oxidoreductase RutF